MGHKPSTPTYDVQYRTTDYIQTPYNVNAPQAMAEYTPTAMQLPQYNTEAALAEQNRLSSTIGAQQYANVNSPLGGYSISVDPTTGQMTVNKSLSDNSTTALEKQNQALNTYTGDPTEAANAYYNAQMAYLQPQLDRQVERAESSLTNRGLPLGSSAWNSAMGDIYDAQNRTLSSLSNQALANGQQYQSNILNQAGMLGSQVIDPSMVAGQGGAGLSDIYNNQYNAGVAQAQADYENALLRYNNQYQDVMNQYQNDLNAYNAMLSNNQGQYTANLSNNQGLWQNDVNKYQNAVQNYQTQMANRNALTSGILGTVGMVGGAALGGPVGAAIGGALLGNATKQ